MVNYENAKWAIRIGDVLFQTYLRQGTIGKANFVTIRLDDDYKNQAPTREEVVFEDDGRRTRLNSTGPIESLRREILQYCGESMHESLLSLQPPRKKRKRNQFDEEELSSSSSDMSSSSH